MLVNLEHLTDGPNARTVPVPPAADKALARSVAASGILQPILVRPLTMAKEPGKYEIVLGNRRVRAARANGISEIPAEVRDMDDIEVRKAQVVENLQREGMHPVDQWRAVRELMLDGVSVTDAANALGLDDRAIRRMEHLGRLNHLLLKLVEIQMPSDQQLRAIANAPVKTQQAIAKRKDLLTQRGEVETVGWQDIAMACRIERIARSVAIFDWEKTKITWEEDLFAQPGADDQFSTLELDKFMTAQRAALEARVQQLGKAKRKARLSRIDDRGNMEFPKGFRRVFDGNIEKPRRAETLFLAIGLDGAIVTQLAAEVATETRKKAAKTGAPWGVTPKDGEADADDAPEENIDEVVTEVLNVKSPLTKEGLGLVAKARQIAVRRALDTPMTTLNVLALLVLALCADNVVINSEDMVGAGRFNDLAFRMLDPTGNPIALSEADMVQIGQNAIGRILQFRGPNTLSYMKSGPAGEWIGHSINAREHLPRFDTEEFLATVNGEGLRRIAQDVGITEVTTSVKALRAALVGKAPDYRPKEALFGAPAPRA
jgi:ParB/RepB/Spo0J family partition protein